MDLATLTNSPRTITLAGEDFTVSCLTMREWGGVQAWIKANAPSPAEALREMNVDGLSPFAARTLMSVAVKAQQGWPPRIGSQEWFDALDRIGKDGRNGNAVWLHAVIVKHRPAFTYENAEDLRDRTTNSDVLRLCLVSLGVDPDAPKDQGPTTPAPLT